ncbi:MAG: sialate O-acetylesterase [Cyclobacteriaceae bacterium]
MKIIYQQLIVLSLALLLSQPAQADVTLAKIFGDNMVLQRDTVVTLWGWADPNEKIKISIGVNQYKAKAEKDGSWTIKIGPFQAGGPYELTVKGKNEIKLNGVLFGEVWLCGGQSNMQFTLRMLGKNVAAIEGVNNDQIRLFQPELDLDYLPKKDLKSGYWRMATTQTVPDFSATAFFFGKYLYDSLKVPIGLVSINLGATSIETWMSTRSLKPFPQFKELVDEIENRNKNFEQLDKELQTFRESWDEAYYMKGPGFDQKWFLPQTDTTDWKSITIPNFWEYEGLDHDGAVWFRKKFDLPPNYKADSFQINLNQIDDYDITWVNGVKVGETFGNRNWRNYSVPTNILKPTDNDLVVRVFDIGGLGGLHTSAFWGNPILLGEWKYKAGLKIDTATFPIPDVPNGSIFSYPSLLYNGNIAPVTSFAIKGAIWYQGESNASRAEEYSKLLPAMIRNWRTEWGYNFPFLIVQLANYGMESKTPVGSDWAELRQAQHEALIEPNVFLATAIDIGEADDIHPKNKEEVGRRLGLGALKFAYGRDIAAQSPAYDQMIVNNNEVILEFKQVGNGLITDDKFAYIRGFQIAGADQKFYWAKAELKENTVVVSSKKVKNPVAVRYAWADNPGPLDLYSSEGLPVLPFRTDNWPLKTAGKVYVNSPHQF